MPIQAKAAIQGGFRRGNARERSALVKINKDVQDRKGEQTTSSSDSSRYIHYVDPAPRNSAQSKIVNYCHF